jgi:HAD superfamily hydrolase (TIGR01509 family)
MASTMRRLVKGVLFDLDGTLVDTTYLHAVTWWQALQEHGHTVAMARIHRAVGMGADKLLAEVLGADHDTKDDAGIGAAHDRLFAAWHELVSPLPGARELLRRCAHTDYSVVLATSGRNQDLRALRGVLDADDVIDVATSAEDADESKPSPDILSVALDKAALRADEVVFVGDAVWDVRASTALQIPCIGLECGGTTAADLRDAGAVETWRDPAELLRHFNDSILGSGT